MKRNLEDNYRPESQQKRFSTPITSPQNYNTASGQLQQSANVLSAYQFLPYPGNLMYTRPPHWSPQTNRYGYQTNMPPPPNTPPPSQPPPPPATNANSSPPIFDLTQPPPPIRGKLQSSIGGSNNPLASIPGPSSSFGIARGPNPSVLRSNFGSRALNFRGSPLRQRGMFNVRNMPPNVVRPTNNQNGKSEEPNGKAEGQKVMINRKNKRKPMSARYMRSKDWEREDAEKALQLESEFNKMQKTPMLILKFPDPDLNKHIVKKYSTAIETVHFQQPSTARYCFITLKDGSDIEKIKNEISEIPFGTGKITAEQKFTSNEIFQPVSPEEIDPYTLYIGNLPTKVNVQTVKQHFPGAARIDIGYAQRMKYTRYAFIRYDNVEDSMNAYRRTFNSLIGNRSLIVRFRRSKGNIGMPGESKIPNAPKQKSQAQKKPDEIIEESNTQALTKPGDAKVSQNESSIKGAENDVSFSINSDEYDEEDDEEEEEEESKENVLDEARKMRLKIIENSKKNNLNMAIKREGIDDELDDLSSKPESSEAEVANLLGTRIKEEPLDDDELLACATSYNINDDFDEEEPEEEDYFPENRVNTNLLAGTLKQEKNQTATEGSCDQSFSNDVMPQFFNNSDVKPDLATLPPNPYTTAGYGLNDKSFDNPRSRIGFLSSRIQQSNAKRKSSNLDKDDDEDIFDNLNADDEFDGLGAF